MSQYTRQQLDNIRIATQAARSAGISTTLFLRQMKQEAHFNDLTSRAGAQGPAQLMPGTARGWGVTNVHDPHQAYTAAATNMAKYLHAYGGDWSKALTAYNAGPGRVGGPLPAETRNYIQTILGSHDPVAPTTAAAKSSKPAKKTYGVVSPGAAPTLTPGGETVDTKGALTAALLNHHGGSLAKRIIGEITSGRYTTTTAPKVTAGTSPKYAAAPAAPAKTTKRAGGGGGIHGSEVLELIHNDGGKGYGIKNGQTVNGASVFSGVWAGHANHVHVAAGPKTVVELGKLAQSMGLHVSENPHFGGVSPVHVAGSYHYKGEAIDASGTPQQMNAFSRAVAKYNRTR